MIRKRVLDNIQKYNTLSRIYLKDFSKNSTHKHSLWDKLSKLNYISNQGCKILDYSFVLNSLNRDHQRSNEAIPRIMDIFALANDDKKIYNQLLRIKYYQEIAVRLDN